MIKPYLKVEIADTPYKLQKGLMFRDKLGADDGMLFKFRHPQNLRFWGLNTYIPLSIAFVSPDNVIQKISYISPLSTSAVVSDVDCNMAIEANCDFFTRHRIKEGQKVRIVEEDGVTFISFEDYEE